MKREIKFRGKVSKTKQWVYGDLLHVSNGCIITTNSELGETLPDGDIGLAYSLDEFAVVIPETVGQFTGLLDKNGKEIYEGDILRGDEYPYNCDGVDNYFVEIVWADNVCGFYRITHKTSNSTVRGISHGNWSELDEEDIKSFEVIGNIHDNPEFLK